MTDILKQYYENFILYKNKSFKNAKKSLILSNDLSEYGIYLSENNILKFTPQKKSYSLLRRVNSNKNKFIFPSYSSKKFTKKRYNTSKISTNVDDNNIINIKENIEKNLNIKNEVQNISNIPNNKNTFNKLKNKNYNIQRNTLLENYRNNLIYINQNNHINDKINFIENNNNIKNPLNIKNKNNIDKKILLFKKKKEEEDKEVDLIVDKLMRKNHKYRKNTKLKPKFSFLNLSPKQSVIDQMDIIKFNLLEYPNKSNLYASYKEQINALGNENYRQVLLDGINSYNNIFVKYKDLRGPTGYDSKNKNLTMKKKINNMFRSYNSNVNLNKNILLKNKNMIKDKQILTKVKIQKKDKIDKSKIILDARKTNDIDKLNNYIEKNHKFLSFDKKVDLLLLSAQKTTNFINKRSKEYQKINNIIFKATT